MVIIHTIYLSIHTLSAVLLNTVHDTFDTAGIELTLAFKI